MTEQKRIVSVVGPTASGKTSLAVQLAKTLGGEVVSCDSMQVYKDMDIATAAPSEQEKQGVAHHMLAVVDAAQSFSVVEYCKQARKIISDIISRGKIPVLCGGTGLYYSSLVDGITFSESAELPQLREELWQTAQEQGGEVLLAQLSQFDHESAQRLHSADIKRIIRAIEVYRATGITMTEHLRRSRQNPSDIHSDTIYLNYRDRQKLYDRIDRRVDIMLELGLLDEVRRFFMRKDAKTAVQAIGYKELKPYLDGECTLEQAAENLKRATRRYAKRQISWFGRDARLMPLFADDFDNGEDMLRAALKMLGRGEDI